MCITNWIFCQVENQRDFPRIVPLHYRVYSTNIYDWFPGGPNIRPLLVLHKRLVDINSRELLAVGLRVIFLQFGITLDSLNCTVLHQLSSRASAFPKKGWKAFTDGSYVEFEPTIGISAPKNIRGHLSHYIRWAKIMSISLTVKAHTIRDSSRGLASNPTSK